jgi:hypothetical protein
MEAQCVVAVYAVDTHHLSSLVANLSNMRVERREQHARDWYPTISDYYSTEGSYQVALALAEASRDKHQRVVTLRGHASAALEVHQYE